MASPVLPILHMNGTSYEALLSLRCAAGRAVEQAMHALGEMYPHGRDYYLAPDADRFQRAKAQTDRRIAVLQAVYAELQEEVLALAELKR